MYRGSRKHILDWLEHPRLIPELLAFVEPACAKLTSRSAWAPMGYRFPDEARLEDWAPRHFGKHPAWADLGRWWLAAPRGANTPNWDLALVAELEGVLGLVLVEAKANLPELSPAGKGPPIDSEGSRANHKRIAEAIESARRGLSVVTPDIAISRDSHYQLSNRLAFTWKLAALGIPVALLYLGFLGDDGICDVGRPFHDAAHCTSTLDIHLDAVGACGLFEQRHQLEGAAFWMMARAKPVIEVSPCS